jgi:hypothetical protein
MLQTKAVDEKVLGLIRRIQSLSCMNGFFLVGGTALALFLGHRKSIDIDLFTDSAFDEQPILEQLAMGFNFELHFASRNTLKGSVDGVKTDILAHRYPYVEEPVNMDGIRLLSMPDIAAMKLNAISINGQRIKDFIDLYFLLERYSIHDLITFYRKKYTLQNDAIVLKSLVWFEDVEPGDWPEVIKEPKLTWNTVKKKLTRSVKEYL